MVLQFRIPGIKPLTPVSSCRTIGLMVTDSFVPPGLSTRAEEAPAAPMQPAPAELTVAEAIGLGVRGLIDRVIHGGAITITRKSQPLIELRSADSGCSCDRSTL